MAMEPRDEAMNDEEKQEKLDQDYDPPFSPAEDIKGARRLSKEDPHLDGNDDTDEWYQEGAAAAGGLPDDQSDEGQDEDEHGERIA